ncbi:hypothetical protein D5018_14395 [Parashewanella curva]|uniref:Uncharacterized protein n=1 Tax=Parashewanella curva TaxID=2338552 RepID=A0A3L8PUB5_9GAMM|nr:hypothetical protein [Parashewanella curva]RLV59015.1 hypothetical protein D5018_14395 [Parashewanella curva]
MALTRKQWNNIIILASAAMIGTLTVLHNKTANIPDDAIPLFDQQATIKQISVDGYTLTKNKNNWDCQPKLEQCQLWQQAWHQLKISPIAQPSLSDDKFKHLEITVQQSPQPMSWQFYTQDGFLKSASGNWYKIPPSLQNNLLPTELNKE